MAQRAGDGGGSDGTLYRADTPRHVDALSLHLGYNGTSAEPPRSFLPSRTAGKPPLARLRELRDDPRAARRFNYGRFAAKSTSPIYHDRRREEGWRGRAGRRRSGDVGAYDP